MSGPVEIATPMVGETLFLVMKPGDGEALLASGVGRGRIVSLKELELLRGLGKDEVRALLEAKVQFDARIQDLIGAKP